MNYQSVLKKLENEDISPELAYKELYPEKPSKPGKRASFIKLRVRVPEEGKGLNTFLRILFAFPIPLVFARWGLRFASKHSNIEDKQDLDVNEILKFLKYSRGTKVSIDSNDAKVDIKII